jgi:phospholipase D-like protein
MDTVGSALGGILFLSVLLGFFVFWIWSLVDTIRVPDESAFRAGSKVIWVVVIAVTGFIGSIVYLVMGRPRTA